MNLVTALEYDALNNSMLLTVNDLDVTLDIHRPRYIHEIQDHHPGNFPSVLACRHHHLAVYASSMWGATRLGRFVFLQAECIDVPYMTLISDIPYIRRAYSPRQLIWEEVDNNGNMWTEIQTLDAKSRMLKYNLMKETKDANESFLYDVIHDKDLLLMRRKSERDSDPVSPNPYLFSEQAIRKAKFWLRMEDGDYSFSQAEFLRTLTPAG